MGNGKTHITHINVEKNAILQFFHISNIGMKRAKEQHFKS